jgi:hypothetical protein
MAAGDAYVVGPASVANNGYLDLATTSSLEAVIHNIGVPGGAELHFFDGTNDVLVGTVTSNGWFNQAYHITQTKRYRVKNTSGSTVFMYADGIYTK